MDTSHENLNPSDVVLEARDIVRRYPGTTALKNVNFRVVRNKINVLIGENGAGKSTLVRILAGAETPTSGQVLFNGVPVPLRSTREASSLGIAMVHQELNVLPNLNLAENIFAGREICGWFGLVKKSEQAAISTEALSRLGSPMKTSTLAGALPLGRQQIVELARSLAHESSVLILDEPTSSLSQAESDTLFKVISDLKQQGVSIVYISHRLNELLLLGDFFTILRDGSVVGEAQRAEVDRHWIVERMTGKSIEGSASVAPGSTRETILSVQKLYLQGRSSGDEARSMLEDISFSARAGEILGIYGLLGSGRTELMEALAGLRSGTTGSVSVRGKLMPLDSVSGASKAGIALVPEDRQRDGLVASLTIRENMALACLDKLKSGLFVSRTKELQSVSELAAELNLKVSDFDLPVTSLSGGNQQKVVLARCLMRSPVVLLLDEPTRGVDVGAKSEIYRILRSLADGGMCVIFTSSEIEETIALAQNILVLSRGRVAAQMRCKDASEDGLFAAAGSYLNGPDKLQ